MEILIYVTAVLVSLVLKRQEKKHRLQIGLVCERIGIPVPRPGPRLEVLESLLNVFVGIPMVVLGLFAVAMMLDPLVASKVIQGSGVVALFLAGGVTLIIYGILGVVENVRWKKAGGASGTTTQA